MQGSHLAGFQSFLTHLDLEGKGHSSGGHLWPGSLLSLLQFADRPFPLASSMNYLSLLFEVFLGFFLYPSPLTEYQILYSHPSIKIALNDRFYAISDKHFLDFHTSHLKEASSSSLQFLTLLQVFTYNTSYLYHYKMYSSYSRTIIPLLFHCNILLPLR